MLRRGRFKAATQTANPNVVLFRCKEAMTGVLRSLRR
jgi:hypothetical protein